MYVYVTHVYRRIDDGTFVNRRSRLHTIMFEHEQSCSLYISMKHWVHHNNKDNRNILSMLLQQY